MNHYRNYGSSKLTRAGLTANTELNALEDDYRIVKSTPRAESDDHGHLSWFDKFGMYELTEKMGWKDSLNYLAITPVGDLMYIPYDM